MSRAYLTTFFLFVCTGLCLSPLAFADSKTYTVTMPLLDSMGKQQASVFNSFLKTIAAVFEKSNPEKIEIRAMLNKAEYLKAVASGNLDIIAAKDAMPGRAGEGKYRAFIYTPLYGETLPKRCLYVNTKSSAAELKDLKGKSLTISSSKNSYYALRKLLGGVDPNTWFGVHARLKDNASGVYAAAMEQTDVVAIKAAAVRFMATTNPGPVKKLKPIICFNDDVWLGAAYNPKRVRFDFIQRFQTFTAGLSKNPDPSIRRFLPFFRQTGLAVQPLKHEEAVAIYRQLSDLEKEAKAKGWAKDYTRWLNLMKQSK